MNVFKLRAWSPYVVGALIGVLSWFSFASVDKPIGITTGLCQLVFDGASKAVEAVNGPAIKLRC